MKLFRTYDKASLLFVWGVFAFTVSTLARADYVPLEATEAPFAMEFTSSWMTSFELGPTLRKLDDCTSAECQPNAFRYDPVSDTGLFASWGSHSNNSLVNLAGGFGGTVAATSIPTPVALFGSALLALFGIGRRLQR